MSDAREPDRTGRPADTRPDADFPEGAWDVPLELVLAVPTSSVMQALIRTRFETQDWPHGMARVTRQGKRFFAEVFYGPNRNSVFFPLDVYAAENGLAR